MAAADLLQKLIETLNPKEFDEVAICYLRRVEGLTSVVPISGSYDSGIDLENRKDPAAIQYQVTTTEKVRYDRKLREDLAKASKNHQQLGLSNSVKYFYSKALSNHRRLILQKEALDSNGLRLDIVEATRLSEAGTIYSDLGDLIIRLSGIERFKKSDAFFDDVKVKGFYELITHGSPSDIKYNLLESFCTHHLFLVESLPAEDLLELVQTHFGSGVDQTYFDILLHKLSTNQKVKLVKESNHVLLRDTERKRITQSLNSYQFEEALLKKELEFVLSDFGLTHLLDELINKLLVLFESNYAINVTEFIGNNGNIDDFFEATRQFETWLRKQLKASDKDACAILSRRILDVCDGHSLLKKISAGTVLSKFSDTDLLQEYFTRNASNKEIFLDANVLVHLACVALNNRSSYDNYNYNVACQLQQFALENGLHFKTTKQYARELEHQLVQALRLVPFASLPLFQQLGGTRNAFYRFYDHLRSHDELEQGVESFSDFLSEMGYEYKHGIVGHYGNETEFLLGSMNVQVELFAKHYEIDDTYRIIESDSANRQFRKSAFAVSNDAIMFARLADKDSTVNPRDPIFCTWDLTLVKAREQYFIRHLNSNRWFIYTPARLMDYYSMMKLRIRPGAISREVMAIVGDKVDLQGETRSLLDTMLAVINPNQEVGIRYARHLAELRDNNVYRVRIKFEAPIESYVEVSAVDIMFNEMLTNYMSPADPEMMRSFKELFADESRVDSVLAILTDEIGRIAKAGKPGKLSSVFTSSLDELISKE